MTDGERIRLVDLAPRWWTERHDRRGMGVSFLCPHCRQSRIVVAFDNPLDGGPPTSLSKVHHQRAGETFDDLTIRPSIDHSTRGHWHGHVTSGDVHA